MMNRSMSDLGDAFYKNRVLDQQKSEHAANRDLQQRMLDESIAAGKYARRPQTAKISAYLTTEDNPKSGITFQGTPEQLQQQEEAFTRAHPDKKALILPEPPKEFAAHEIGVLHFKDGTTRKFYDDAAFQTAHEQASAAGVLTEEKNTHILNMQPGAQAFDTHTGTVLHSNPSAALSRAGMQEITEKLPAVESAPAMPARKGFLGIGARPEVPAVAGHGEMSIKRTQPVGAPPIPATIQPPAPMTNSQAANPNTIKKRIRVRGPGNVTGTIEEGDALPSGWTTE